MVLQCKLYFQFHDLKRYAESGSLHESARLERSVALFNGLTQWVQCMVLSRTTPQERAEVIDKFINVAKVRMAYCLQKNRFSTTQPLKSFN